MHTRTSSQHPALDAFSVYCSVAISSFILAIAIAGFRPFGHVFEHCESSAAA